MTEFESGPVEEYLADDRTMEVMVTAMIRWREQQTGETFFDGHSAELAVFILNALQDDRGVPDDREALDDENLRTWEADRDAIDRSVCHCGKPADGHVPGYCKFCSDVRCDADPGACRDQITAYKDRDGWHPVPAEKLTKEEERSREHG